MEGFPQNKRESGVARIIGVGDKEERKTVGVGPEEKKMLGYFESVFSEQNIGQGEKEMPEEFKELVSSINLKLKDFLANYGAEVLMIPVENIHTVDRSALTEDQVEMIEERFKNNSGVFFPEKQGILMLRDYIEGGKLRFAQTLVHEMLHMNSFQSFEVEKSGEGIGVVNLLRKSEDGKEEKVRLTPRRVGFRIFQKNGDAYFYKIDEAIIQELAMRFERGYFAQMPELREEYEKKQRVISYNTGEEDEVKKKGERIAYIESEQQKEGGWKTTIGGYSYQEEREALNKLIDDLYEKNRDEFSSREGVFDMFARGVMTGKLLAVGDLITKTYGRGSFRELGEKTIKKADK